MKTGDAVQDRSARHFTIRARLALTYAALLGGTGGLMLGVVYVFMRFVPTYELTSATSLTPTTPAATPDSIALQKSADGVTASVPALPVVSSTGELLNLLLTVSIAAFVVLGVVGATIGWIISGRVLKPLQRINSVAQRAASGDLRQRVDATGPRDEIRDLSDTVDDMLAKLERSFQEHQRFSANASHELRTPIATTQTLLDVALSDPELDLPTLRTVAERVYATNKRNIETVESLLDLAEAGSARGRHDDIDLTSMVRSALADESAAIAAAALTVTSDLSPAALTGDSVLVRQAVRNLVQNAVRHNVHGGTIELSTTTSHGETTLVIANSGPVLAPDVVESLVEPFVRGLGRTAERRGPRGHGLGLTLVKSVTDAHHGSLRISGRESGGLRIELTMPTESTRVPARS
ncbi:HAMP domain-containing histidine kinase [Leifsonia shinshuensis]|uniref:sensor histidine kinase n=1 Tax=Leifsonia shinshuensis TaxID=150026 RepID=UPI001F506684|nr:HAMP domain-containing sensor histidine kinase [Leifsonia shinshuensis]MCI0158777.1 HAMP domain-containing histidine kinase [Leifsonia shinshuensis]